MKQVKKDKNALTLTEYQVLALFRDRPEMSPQEVAVELDMAKATVDWHLGKIYVKLNCKSLAVATKKIQLLPGNFVKTPKGPGIISSLELHNMVKVKMAPSDILLTFTSNEVIPLV